MSQPTYDCDADLVIELQESSPGVEEILQYARGCLLRTELRALIQGLEQQLETRPEAEPVPCAQP